jgi:serine/threonine protein kinase
LKPSNVLINGRGEAIIGDFGTSRSESNDNGLMPDCGTVHYAAPEMFRENGECTEKVDVFSFGTVLYEIVTGSPVFPTSMFAFPVVRKVLSGEMPSLPDKCGHRMQELIRRCWSMNPECRPSFDEIMTEFRTEMFELLPGADSSRLGNYVRGGEDWERMMTDFSREPTQ